MVTDKCELIGRLFGKKWQKCFDMGRRVYSVEGLSPTVLTFSGGNTESKVLVPNYRFYEQAKYTLMSVTRERAGLTLSIYIKYSRRTERPPTVK